MREMVLKTILVTLLIITLTMANVIVAGIGLVSYALDGISANTSHKNVEFMAYFKNGEEKITSKEEAITNDDIKLYMSISVKNEGYFNGEIELSEGNFNLKQDKLSDRINKIDGNKITLNQVNSGETVEIEVAVTPIKDDSIDLRLLNMESTLKLVGTYKDSTQENITVNAEKQVNLVLEPEENTNVVLNSEILTNKTYQIDGENKKLVQVLVESGLENNSYPIKTTEIEATVPENVEDVEVFSRGMIATNGKLGTEFADENYEYVKEQNKVIIKVQNDEQDGKICWTKSGRDVFVITYVLSEDENVLDEQIDVKSKVELYNSKNTVVNGENVIKIEEEKDGIVNYSIMTEESSIYKGKIYSGEDREYKAETSIYVNNLDVANSITVKEQNTTYIVGENEILANSQYKITKINKQQVMNMLGEEGNLQVLDNNLDIIGIINKDTKEDENGYVEIIYPEGITAITVKTSKPEKIGTIAVENIKVLKENSYSKDTLKVITGLKEVILSNYNSEKEVETNAVIELKETVTEAELTINKDSLSTMEDVQNLQIEVRLDNNLEEYDLYKNPVIKIQLPSQIENITVNSINLLYENELVVNSVNLLEGNVLEIKLNGEQTFHRNDDVIKGATIIINADVSVNKKVTSSDEKIILNYINENAISYNSLESGVKEISLKIVAPRDLVTINSVDENTVIGESETKESELEIEAEAKDSEVELEVLNNNTNVIENVMILGRFPTKGTVQVLNEEKENTIDTAITTDIKTSGIDDSKVKIYYSEDENATIDNSSWTEQIINGQTVKSYLISVDNMEPGEGIVANYGVYIPENLGYNQVAFENYSVTYTEGVSENVINAAAIALATELDEDSITNMAVNNQDIQVTLNIANEDDKVQIGKSNKYILKLVNNTSEDKSNLNVSIVNDGSVGDIMFEDFDDEPNGTIDLLKAGEEKDLLIYIQPNVESKKTNLTIVAEVEADGKKYTSNKLVKEISNPRVEIELSSANMNGKVRNKESIQYDIKITNVGNMDINSMTIKDKLSTYFKLDTVSITQEGSKIEYDRLGNEFTFSISLNKGEIITLNIKADVEDYMGVNPIYISNKIVALLDIDEIGNSNEVKHILVPDGMEDDYVDSYFGIEKDDGDTDDDSGEYEEDFDDENGTDSDDIDVDDNKDSLFKISGKAWIDENKDGKKDSTEKLLDGVNVRLLNMDTKTFAQYNNEDIIAVTDEDGYYKLEKIKKGKYLVLFEYDTSKYTVTEYMTSGVAEANNSNVIIKNITIEGKNSTYAVTNTIDISDKSILNINIGLVEIEKFDLELNKYISKVVVQNNDGTKEYTYNDASLAKVEVAAKQLNNTKIVVEYTIKVSNNGEVDGYVKNIVDYMPSDFKFSSELNKDWYQSEGCLYNKSLANNKIKIGETKEVKLILTKTMTNSNTGLINNTAEIAECYNDLGTTDIDSTPKNKVNGEDDMGSAELIISVKTGEILTVIGLTMIILMSLAIGVWVVYKKIYRKEVNNEKDSI